MEAKELRQLNPTELGAKVKQWQEELFRVRIKGKTSELKDTSVFGKLRKDIARAKTVLGELKRSGITSPVLKQAQSIETIQEAPATEKKKEKKGTKKVVAKEHKK